MLQVQVENLSEKHVKLSLDTEQFAGKYYNKEISMFYQRLISMQIQIQSIIQIRFFFNHYKSYVNLDLLSVMLFI